MPGRSSMQRKFHTEMSLLCKPSAKHFEDRTLDSGYGDAADSCQSSVLSLSPSSTDALAFQRESLWTMPGSRKCRGNTEDTLNSYLDSECEVLDTLDFCPKLPPLEDVPWTEDEIVTVIKKSQSSNFKESISKSLIKRCSTYLGRALLRLAKEAQRLSVMSAKCTKHEVQSAAKIVLSWTLSEICAAAAIKALSLYNMSAEDQLNSSKSSLCGLTFSVSRFFRWMVDSRLATRIHEHAAIYLTAYMESLFEEVNTKLLSTLHSEGKERLDTVEKALEFTVNNDAELWGLFHPSEHLICGKNAYGTPSLPSYLSLLSSNCQSAKASPRPMYTSTELKTWEQSLLTTSVGSIAELGALVGNAMYYLQQLGAKSCASVSQLHFKYGSLSWEPEALHTLHYYMHCPQTEWEDPNMEPPKVKLISDRPYVGLPPVVEWIRTCVAHAEHRHSLTIDSNDVQQAARLLMPSVDCEPRRLRVECCLHAARRLDAKEAEKKLFLNLAFRMLSCGRTDLVKPAIALLGPDGVNTQDEQGMSPLMYACANGDEAMVQVLLDSGAVVDIQVPSNLHKYPSVHPEMKHWTALTFAVAFGHISVVQLILDAGADIEGCIREGEVSETPLQLAAAAGHLELVSLLLKKGADPLVGVQFKHGMSAALNGAKNTFSQAAAHGHRIVLKKLFSQPEFPNRDILSLEDILAEGSESSELVASKSISSRSGKARSKALQEAMYQSAEHGFLDITMELRNLGAPWTLHIWLKSLSTSFTQQSWPVTHCLLKEFSKVKEVYSEEMTSYGIALLFEILKMSKIEATIQEVTAILSRCYGPYPVPALLEIGFQQKTKMDPVFLNNKESHDVVFKVEGRPFYAHKEVLSAASSRFKNLISSASRTNNQTEIHDISYTTFQLVMQFIYNGGAEGMYINKSQALEVFHAANFFKLKTLKRHCEIVCAKYMFPTDCVKIYHQAKSCRALELKAYCEGYFLKNMVALLEVESFRNLLFSTKKTARDGDIFTELCRTLTSRMQSLYQPPSKETVV
ncbi:ankyrin repeat and BTB/POZ domain-containing protein 3-B-like [Latimeria chalumnae]|uniref:BTB domain-containing protein n=1 Tax=Latimeria chalumnae TaxID=7897 RepID=H3ANS7_LATCH|nr:PREDICTED: ankyrin repeat and BTB/POZ domain-containing protein BTBD11-B-like [Latimeria chalumnae]|eukprot:XP_005987648.1 PREDICTED: ankyrin repeat and BTB/POZ domain-containing protein BTBD11-B-like [Latimeria chalumnae]